MSSPSLLLWIPAFTWLRGYNGSWLRGDALAGVTRAAYLVPATFSGSATPPLCSLTNHI